MNDDKLCISPDALIAMIVTEAQDRAGTDVGAGGRGDVQPSDAFLRKNGRAGPQYPAQG